MDSLKRKRELETWLRTENKKLKQEHEQDKQKQIEERRKFVASVYERLQNK